MADCIIFLFFKLHKVYICTTKNNIINYNFLITFSSQVFEARFKNVPSDLVEAKPTPNKISGPSKTTTPLAALPPPPKAQAPAVTNTPIIPPQVLAVCLHLNFFVFSISRIFFK